MINDNEFGRCFEVGMVARASEKRRDEHRYADEIRQLAYSDGWLAADAELGNSQLDTMSKDILSRLTGQSS